MLELITRSISEAESNIKHLIYLCFVSLKQIILESVGHKLGITPLDGVIVKNTFLKSDPDFLLMVHYNF